MSVELYRLRVSEGSGNSSWGETRYYESRDIFTEDLLVACIDEAVNQLNARGSSRLTWRGCSRWREKRFSNRKVTVKTIFKAEQLVDGEWQPVSYEFVAPHISYPGGHDS